METTTTPTPEADEFTIRHCTAWCESVGVDLAYVPTMVAEYMEDGPESTLSWPTIARVVGAQYEDGYAYAQGVWYEVWQSVRVVAGRPAAAGA